MTQQQTGGEGGALGEPDDAIEGAIFSDDQFQRGKGSLDGGRRVVCVVAQEGAWVQQVEAGEGGAEVVAVNEIVCVIRGEVG